MEWVVLLLLVLIIVLQIMIGWRVLNRLKWKSVEENVQKKSPSSVESDESHVYEMEEKWKEEIRRTVQLQCMTIRNAVQKQVDGLHAKEIQYSPRALSIPDEKLRQVYSEEQIDELKSYWSHYKHYINSFWLTSNGTVRTVFSERDALRISQESQKLTYHLNEELREIMIY